MGPIEWKVEIAAASADQADAALLEMGAENWSVLENAIEKRAWVVGIVPSEIDADPQWRNVSRALSAAGVSTIGAPSKRMLESADWRDSYKLHFKPWRFGNLHWVPVWEREAFQLPPGDVVLWLDPGLAFGTGNHETTRLCIERLTALAAARDARALRVIDAGCGSGILALSAVLLGFGEVSAFDNDPEAVRVSEENAALNGLAGRVRFFLGDVVTGLAGVQADVVVANIQADVLIRFARDLTAAVAPGGTLILSGILAIENSEVRGVFQRIAPQWLVDARVMGEWSDVMLVRPL
jgi:ribosomal protein L11 methyltransferase